MTASTTLLALNSATAKLAKQVRSDVAPGTYEVDEVVAFRVTGTVKVSEDETYVPTTSVPTKAALALFMRYAGCTGPHAMEALARAMREAAELGTDAKAAKVVAEMHDVDATMAKVVASLEALPPATRKGKVSCSKVSVKATAL